MIQNSVRRQDCYRTFFWGDNQQFKKHCIFTDMHQIDILNTIPSRLLKQAECGKSQRMYPKKV